MSCLMCDIVEGPPHDRRLVYRCTRCGGCYVCEHSVDLDKRLWRCKDRAWRPVIHDPGIKASLPAAL